MISFISGLLDQIAKENFNLDLKTKVLESGTSMVEGRNIVIVTFRLDFDNVNYVGRVLIKQKFRASLLLADRIERGRSCSPHANKPIGALFL